MKKYLSLIFMLCMLVPLTSSCKTTGPLSLADDSNWQFSWDNVTVYFALTDRFYDGNKSNNNSYGRPSKDAWGTDIATFHGGDIAGMTKKLEENYFTNLGVTAIWITAPYEQIHGFVGGGSMGDFAHYAYHGYYALDYTMMDRNMGTVDEMRKFVDTAHKKGIRVILDIVMNHPGYNTIKDMNEYGFGAWADEPADDNWAPVKDETDWHDYHDLFISYEENEEAWAKWWGPDWVRAGITGYSPSGDNVITESLAYLPDFKTEVKKPVKLPAIMKTKWAKESTDEYKQYIVPATVKYRKDMKAAPADYLVKWLAAWVEEFGIDGFRADTVKHVDIWRWSQLKKECNAALKTWRKNNPDAPGANWKEDFWMTAEVWGHGVEESDYFNYGFDSIINFTFQGEFGDGPAYNASTDMEDTYSQYADFVTSNQKVNVLSYISQHDTFLYSRSDIIQGATNLMLAPGGVQIFYGDETGRMDGPDSSDPNQANRTSMNWNKIDKNALAHFQTLGLFRRRNIAVGAGNHQQLEFKGGYAFSRIYNDNKIAVIIGSEGKVSIDISSLWENGTKLRNAYDNSTSEVIDGKVTFNSGKNSVILIEKI